MKIVVKVKRNFSRVTFGQGVARPVRYKMWYEPEREIHDIARLAVLVRGV